jgi:carboxyl-terminal processing protease
MRPTRGAGVFSAIALALLAAGCGGSRPNPLAPRTYLDRALSLIQSESVAVPSLNWAAVSRHAREMAAHAKTPEETYPAIEYVLAQLRRAGDGHAVFIFPSEAKGGAEAACPLHEPTVALLDKRLGDVVLPQMMCGDRSPAARHYVTTALTGIRTLERKDRPCGWVIDLQGDLGGNVYAMLLAVGPILGEGRVIGFKGRHGFRRWVTYRNGVVSGGGESMHAPELVPVITPAPPVALLTSQETISAGEGVEIAFQGRPQTRTFGVTTAGPHLFRLADGAEMLFGWSYAVDRRGEVYRHAISPDVTTFLTQAESSGWLLSTRACRAARRAS